MRWARGVLLTALAAGLLAGGARPATAGADICPEPNDGPDGACALGSGSSASGYLDSPDDVDRYRIEVGQGQMIQASLGSLPGDYSLRLEEASGAPVIEAGGGGADRALEARDMPAGSYFLVVSSNNGESSADQPYVIKVSVQGSIAGPPLTIDSSAPPPPPAPDRSLDQLVLTLLDAGDKAKASKPTNGSDGRGDWYQVIFKRDSDPQISRLGPEVIINRVYRGKDLPNAQAIYRDLVGQVFPEAKDLALGVGSVGPEDAGGLGDEAQAWGACTNRNCSPERGEKVYRHFRFVFRTGNLVEVIYSYGYESGNYYGVARDLAGKVQTRINTAPAGPPPEIIARGAPGDMGLVIQDAGPQATEMFRNFGSDDRASWYESRFERGEETVNQKLGPNIIYNKVFVANGSDNARAIFKENAVKALPEATTRKGAPFVEPKTKSFGNESFAIGACNDNCDTDRSQYLHERLVYRWGNVVVILYLWGREDQANPDVLATYASLINGRVR